MANLMMNPVEVANIINLYRSQLTPEQMASPAAQAEAAQAIMSRLEQGKGVMQMGEDAKKGDTVLPAPNTDTSNSGNAIGANSSSFLATLNKIAQAPPKSQPEQHWTQDDQNLNSQPEITADDLELDMTNQADQDDPTQGSPDQSQPGQPQGGNPQQLFFNDFAALNNYLGQGKDFNSAYQELSQLVDPNQSVDVQGQPGQNALQLLQDSLKQYFESATGDPNMKLQLAEQVYNALPGSVKGQGAGQQGVVEAPFGASGPAGVDPTQAEAIRQLVKTSCEEIQKLAISHAKVNAKQPITKEAQAKSMENVLMWGPGETRIDPFLRGPVSDWHIVERNKGFGLQFADVWNIDWESIWRNTIMDKYSRPYRDAKTGEWVGGYLNKRFETDKWIPETNNYQLKPGEKRRPYLPEYGLTEARLEAMRAEGDRGYEPNSTGKPFDWATANTENKMTKPFNLSAFASTKVAFAPVESHPDQMAFRPNAKPDSELLATGKQIVANLRGDPSKFEQFKKLMASHDVPSAMELVGIPADHPDYDGLRDAVVSRFYAPAAAAASGTQGTKTAQMAGAGLGLGTEAPPLGMGNPLQNMADPAGKSTDSIVAGMSPQRKSQFIQAYDAGKWGDVYYYLGELEVPDGQESQMADEVYMKLKHESTSSQQPPVEQPGAGAGMGAPVGAPVAASAKKKFTVLGGTKKKLS